MKIFPLVPEERGAAVVGSKRLRFLSCTTPSVPGSYLEQEERLSQERLQNLRCHGNTEKGVLRCCSFQGLLEMLLLVGKISLCSRKTQCPRQCICGHPRSGTIMILGTLCILSNTINVTFGSPFPTAWDKVEGEQLIHVLFLVIREFKATTLHLCS